MHIKWKKLLFRLVGLNFLSQEAGKWLQHFKEDLKTRLRCWILRGSFLILMFVLLKLAFLLGLIGLSLYLNERFYSTYQGFLVVAGGCLGIILLLFIILQLFGFKKKETRNW
jgi:hypothetical protein